MAILNTTIIIKPVTESNYIGAYVQDTITGNEVIIASISLSMCNDVPKAFELWKKCLGDIYREVVSAEIGISPSLLEVEEEEIKVQPKNPPSNSN